MRYDQSAVLVTGGASGRGRSVAEAGVARGADVVVLDLPGAADTVHALGKRVRFSAADANQVRTPVADAASRHPRNGEGIRLDGAVRMSPR